MIELNCEWLHSQAYLNCYTVETINGEQAICVQTHHRWLDNTPLTFYISPYGDKLLISDEGETLFHFNSVGLLSNKRSWRKVRELLSYTQSDVVLEDDGEILCMTTPENAAIALADYTAALCALLCYEQEISQLPTEVVDFADEVEFYLKAWKPNQMLISSPKIKGISGHEYLFDFQLGNQLILAINPTPNAVGSAMRRIGDVLSGGELDNRTILVIVDNRSDQLFEQQKAEEEISIISTLAKAVPFTNLMATVEKHQSTNTAH